MFAFGDRKWPGLSKLVEECSELVTVLGKLLQARGERKHWSGDLIDMIHEEIADVTAAIEFAIRYWKLDRGIIAGRAARKLELFQAWHRGQAGGNRP